MTFRTRFAPSPTGPLHLGHAYSALLAHDAAKFANGEFILRIEDTDAARCKPKFETVIYEDLAWLGLTWQTPVMLQSDRRGAYDDALKSLEEKGFCYPCDCSRRDIRKAMSAPQEINSNQGAADASVYPGTCRNRPMNSRSDNDAIRLNVGKVWSEFPGIDRLWFTEIGPVNGGEHTLSQDRLINRIGDFVLFRRDIQTASYHLSVVVDDAAQVINHIIRGTDLFDSTFVHILLQALLDLPTPKYHHHRLIRDDAGNRLAKRDDARAIRTYREKGFSPADIRQLVDL